VRAGFLPFAARQMRGARSSGASGVSSPASRVQGATKKKKIADAPTYLNFWRFLEFFWSDFRKYFCGVFGLLELNKNKNRRKNLTGKKKKSQLFRPKVFDMDFPQKVFVWCL
jgi:hypothetical protein